MNINDYDKAVLELYMRLVTTFYATHTLSDSILYEIKQDAERAIHLYFNTTK